MSTPMPPPELTLIVAATRTMGIGQAGTLPWTGLRKEMAYFARVTKRRVPQNPNPHTSTSTSTSTNNAVIMGRKTWDSIPPRFRPLKGRVNVVVSRSHATSPARAEEEEDGDGPVRVSSLEQAVAHLHAAASSFSADAPGPSRAFVIGGAQMYAAALQLREARRVLLTRVLEPDFACDTFFPLVLSEAGGGGWVRRSKEELDAWAGETVPEGVQEENGTRYEFQMWERVD